MKDPKRTKYRKAFKGKASGIASQPKIVYGSFGIKSLDNAIVSARLLEACRRKLTFSLKRQGRVWTRVFPDIPVTRKPGEVRMGKGKGSPKYFIVRAQPGQFLFELEGMTYNKALQAYLTMKKKLGFQTKLVK